MDVLVVGRRQCLKNKKASRAIWPGDFVVTKNDTPLYLWIEFNYPGGFSDVNTKCFGSGVDPQRFAGKTDSIQNL